MTKTLIICCFLLMLIIAAAEAVDPTIVLYLPLDENQGDDTADLSGNGNDGFLEDSPKWIPGKFGKALEFGAGSRVYIPASDSLHGDIFMEDFTLLAWIMPTLTGDTWQHVWRSVDGEDGTQCTLFFNTGGFLSWRGRVDDTWGERCVTPEGMIPADEWTHIAVVSDRSDYRIYINGAEEGTSTFEELDGDIADFYLGFDGREWAETYTGAIDEVYLLTRALSAVEVMNAMAGIDMSVQPAGKLAGTWGDLKR